MCSACSLTCCINATRAHFPLIIVRLCSIVLDTITIFPFSLLLLPLLLLIAIVLVIHWCAHVRVCVYMKFALVAVLYFMSPNNCAETPSPPLPSLSFCHHHGYNQPPLMNHFSCCKMPANKPNQTYGICRAVQWTDKRLRFVPLWWQLEWISFRSQWLTKAQFGDDTHNKTKRNEIFRQ